MKKQYEFNGNIYSTEREYCEAMEDDFFARAEKYPELCQQFLSRVREFMLEGIEEEREDIQSDLERRLGIQKMPLRKFKLREEY